MKYFTCMIIDFDCNPKVMTLKGITLQDVINKIPDGYEVISLSELPFMKPEVKV